MPHHVARLEPADLPIVPAPAEQQRAAREAARRARGERLEPLQRQFAGDAEVEVSVCIVNWNCRELLRECLESLLDLPQGVNLEVIVVDNASEDGAAEMVTQDFPDVLLVRNEVNRGFARGNNQAARMSRGRFLFFLNNDTLVPPGSLRRLVDYARAHPEAGIVGPRLREPSGRTQVSYRMQPTLATLLHRTSLMRWTGIFRAAYRRYRRDAFQFNATRPVEVLMGAAMLIPHGVFRDTGGWDEDYTFGGEDLDLSIRIGRCRQLMYHPAVEIIHHGRVSTRQHIGFASSNMNIGFLRFLRKNGSNRLALLAYKCVVTLDLPVQIAAKAFQLCWRRLTRQDARADQTMLALRGLFHFLRHGLPTFWRA
jgi:N-acetylglucosaminyl-diphospho-decaprenol L-rhamnosyltransferase